MRRLLHHIYGPAWAQLGSLPGGREIRCDETAV